MIVATPTDPPPPDDEPEEPQTFPENTILRNALVAPGVVITTTTPPVRSAHPTPPVATQLAPSDDYEWREPYLRAFPALACANAAARGNQALEAIVRATKRYVCGGFPRDGVFAKDDAGNAIRQLPELLATLDPAPIIPMQSAPPSAQLRSMFKYTPRDVVRWTTDVARAGALWHTGHRAHARVEVAAATDAHYYARVVDVVPQGVIDRYMAYWVLRDLGAYALPPEPRAAALAAFTAGEHELAYEIIETARNS